jgi:hypothetical protein
VRFLATKKNSAKSLIVMMEITSSRGVGSSSDPIQHVDKMMKEDRHHVSDIGITSQILFCKMK